MSEPWLEIRGWRMPLSQLNRTEGIKAIDFCLDWLEGKPSFALTTSGSTGTPKKIEMRRNSMIASAKATATALGLHEGMTSLVCLDTGFIAGIMMIVRSIETRMNMIIVEPSANPLEQLQSSKIDFAAMVPYQVNAILQSEQREQLDSIGTIILGGAPVNAELLQEISRLSVSCYATFGMTETLSHIALQKLNGIQRQENFHTLSGVTISQDNRGCLVIETDYLDEKVVTNDLVEILKPGEFKWLGRYDHVINSGGIKVSPEKIEKVVEEWMHGESISNRFFVAGSAHAQLGQEVVLVVEGKFSKETELLENLRATLEKYEVPRQVVYRSRFKQTVTGKIDRSASLHPDLD